MVTNEERLTEMEQRLADMEAELRARQRPKIRVGGILREILPPDVRIHMRAAQRERLLAVRSYLDRAISRFDATMGDGETL
ncbi:MAG: hypothetical protein ACR2JY_03810 [Chloroflexota bacterium]